MSKRLIALLVCMGLMPCIVGCVEDTKANDKDKPVEKAKADSPQSEKPKSAKKLPLEFSELPVNDPLVANAVQAREQITELEEELLERLDELRSVLASAKTDPERMRESVELFVDLTKSMREKTLKANEALNAVSEKTSELSRSSRHLASSYRALAELFRKKARDYSEKKLREQLLDFAKDYDEVAKSIPERSKTLEAVQKKLPALKRKVKEVNSFLSDTLAFLNTHPGIGADPRDRYSAEFESFAVTFTDWIRVLDELRAALREKAVSKVIQNAFRQEMVALRTLEAAKREEIARLERDKQEASAKAEQAKRDEEARLAKLAEAEQQQKLERERVTQVSVRPEPGPIQVATSQVQFNQIPMPHSVVYRGPYVAPGCNCQPVTYIVSPCPQPVTYPVSRPCRVRLFPLFNRG
jgi:chromosome segregation ATPase